MNATTVEGTLARAEAICHGRGARLTPQRRQVLALLLHAGRPVGAYELLEALRREAHVAGPPTIYRALEFLMAQGLVHRIESLHAFVGCNHPGEPHAGQFLICRGCGAVREVQDSAVSQSVMAAAGATGFRAEHPVVEISGRCARCAAASR